MAAMETGIFAERMLGIGEKPEKKIGIYIACHGELIERIVNGTRNVTINKQNLGGYGCPSYIVREPSEHIQTALDLEHKLVGCSREKYQLMKKGLIDKYGVEIDTEGACELFSSMRGFWILKRYTYDATKRAFIIAFQGRAMYMVTCTRPELEEFIGGNLINPTDKKILDDFFIVRDTFFDTQLLFNLIYLFNKHRGVNVANILDESCNVQFKDKKRVPKEDVFPRGPSGYGGKRTRKRKSRKFTLESPKYGTRVV
jgi:hypothetical protein